MTLVTKRGAPDGSLRIVRFLYWRLPHQRSEAWPTQIFTNLHENLGRNG